ncbi:RadC family protein [Alteromonas facilis]|uniref:RadC family protein n=1 Tax=Alteromonas facilis TaxID=2048004 RepID=UPI000C28F6C7|nr:DNA repair protein RadC [Alteromonas facilis]
MRITDWTVNERPREKLLRRGAEFLSDIELLAIFIHSGVAGNNALVLAQRLLDQFGSVYGVLSASESELRAQLGIGKAKYALFKAAVELSTRSLHTQLCANNVFSDVDAVKHYLQLNMSGLQQEVFALMLLNSQHHLISFCKMFYGTINSAAVYPRELVKKAILENAAAVILVHNHPSGIAEPSQADIDITHRITSAMALVDISVLDHFVVGHTNTVSFAQRGLI